MDKVEVKVTWGFVWAFWWKTALLNIAPIAIIYFILFALIGGAFWSIF